MFDNVDLYQDYIDDIEQVLSDAMEQIKKIFELMSSSNVLDKLK